MRTLLLRQALEVLMESPLYWMHSIDVRLDMVRYYIFAQEKARLNREKGE